MARTPFSRSALTQFVNAAEANLKASEPIAAQILSSNRSHLTPTVSRSEATWLSRNDHAIRGGSSSSIMKPCSCGKFLCPGHARAMSTASQAVLVQPAWATDERAPGLADRLTEVTRHFPTALSVDDFISRVEIALAGYGFTGDNTIAMSNLCRDESCLILEDKIEAAFGSCFSTHGLGGVLTCGVIGMKAGLSHSPVVGGKERYVFFSFPHIAIDSDGKVGAVSRPNRPGASAACGALIACLGDLKRDGLEASVKAPGVHDPLEPEYSILKQRIARRLAYEGALPGELSLVDITKAAERVISTDLEYLISKAVDPAKADYGVFSGVQIHNWAADLNNTHVPSLEFVAPGRSYVVMSGEKIHLDLGKVPALSPRQLQILASASISAASATDGNAASAATASAPGGKLVQEIPREYLLRRLGGAQSRGHVHTGLPPAWGSFVRTEVARDAAAEGAPQMDAANTSFVWKSK